MKQFHQNLPGTSLPPAYQDLPATSASMPFQTNYNKGLTSGAPSQPRLPTFQGNGDGQHHRSSEFTPRGGGNDGNEEQDLIGTLLMDEDDAAVQVHGRQDEQMLYEGPQQRGVLINDRSKMLPKGKGQELMEEPEIDALLVLRKQRSSSEK